MTSALFEGNIRLRLQCLECYFFLTLRTPREGSAVSASVAA